MIDKIDDDTVIATIRLKASQATKDQGTTQILTLLTVTSEHYINPDLNNLEILKWVTKQESKNWLDDLLSFESILGHGIEGGAGDISLEEFEEEVGKKITQKAFKSDESKIRKKIRAVYTLFKKLPTIHIPD
jgi:hypothetical protein